MVEGGWVFLFRLRSRIELKMDIISKTIKNYQNLDKKTSFNRKFESFSTIHAQKPNSGACNKNTSTLVLLGSST